VLKGLNLFSQAVEFTPVGCCLLFGMVILLDQMGYHLVNEIRVAALADDCLADRLVQIVCSDKRTVSPILRFAVLVTTARVIRVDHLMRRIMQTTPEKTAQGQGRMIFPGPRHRVFPSVHPLLNSPECLLVNDWRVVVSAEELPLPDPPPDAGRVLRNAPDHLKGHGPASVRVLFSVEPHDQVGFDSGQFFGERRKGYIFAGWTAGLLSGASCQAFAKA